MHHGVTMGQLGSTAAANAGAVGVHQKAPVGAS